MDQRLLDELLIKLGFDDLDGFLKALDGALSDAEQKAKSGGGTGGKAFKDEFEKKAKPKDSFGKDFINALGIISIGTFIGNTLANAFQGALQATQQFVSESNREFRSYQTSLNIIAASGGDNLDKIKDKITELSAESKVFSENQIAQSLSEIIKAGYTTEQAIQLVRSGMQAAKGEIDATTGSYADLSKTTLLVSDVLSGFSKDASEAAKVTDILSKGANESKLGFTDMVQAIAPISGVANQVGLSLEQTVASIAKLRDTGLPAAEASTQLRQILLQLISPPQELKKQMDALGLSITKADGSSRSFPEILDRIAVVANSGAKGVEFLGRVFGTYATNGALALQKNRSALNDFSDSLKDSEGAAKKWADEVNGNGVEAAKNYERQLANARKELGEQLQPVLVTFYTEIAPKFVAGLGSIVTALGLVIDALGMAKVSTEDWAKTYGSSLDKVQAAEVASLLQRRKTIEAQIQLLKKQLENPLTALVPGQTAILKGRISQLKSELGDIIRQLLEIQKQTQKALEPKPAPTPNAFQQVLATLAGGSYVKTQGAGENPNQMGYGAQGHNGLDIVSQSGKVFNPFDQARVIATGFDKYLGNFIRLALSNNTEAFLGHFESVGVEAGQVLAKGAMLGIQGATGNATGPHVHIGFKVGGKTVYSEAELERLMTQFAASGAQAFDESLLDPQKTGKEKSPVLETAKDLENQLKILDAQFARGGAVKTYKASLTDLAAAYKALLGSATTLEEKAAIEGGLTDISKIFDDLDKGAAAARKKAKERDDKARQEQIKANDAMAEAIRENQAKQAEAENKEREDRLAKLKQAAQKEIQANDEKAQALLDNAARAADYENKQREQTAVEAERDRQEQIRKNDAMAAAILANLARQSEAENKAMEERAAAAKAMQAILDDPKLVQRIAEEIALADAYQKEARGASNVAEQIGSIREELEKLTVGELQSILDETLAALTQGFDDPDSAKAAQTILQIVEGLIRLKAANTAIQGPDNTIAGKLPEDLKSSGSAIDELEIKIKALADALANSKSEDPLGLMEFLDFLDNDLFEAFDALDAYIASLPPDDPELERLVKLREELEKIVTLRGQTEPTMMRPAPSQGEQDYRQGERSDASPPTITPKIDLTSLANDLENLILNAGKTFTKGLLEGKPLEALQSIFSTASDFFIGKLVEGILGPIAQQLGKVAAEQLFSQTTGAAAGSAALGPAGLAIAGAAILGTLLFGMANRQQSAAQQASQDAAKARTTPSSVSLKVETAISVYMEGALDNANNRASLTTLVENINMAQLRKLGIFELIEELKRSRK